MNDHRTSRRGAAVLLLIAAFSLLLTFTFLAPRPDAAAMLAGQTVRSSPSLTVVSPLQLPTPTRGPRPSPFVRATIDDPAIIAALWARSQAQPSNATATPMPTASVRSPGAANASATGTPYFLPLTMSGRCENRYAGEGFAAGNAQPIVSIRNMMRVNVDWWYNWGHNHEPADAWYGDPSYAPMVWCADKPGEVVNLNNGSNPNGHWEPVELAANAAAHPGRIWLIYNEPDFPFVRAYQPPPPPGTPTPTPFRSSGQCGEVLCRAVSMTLTPTLPPGQSDIDRCRWALSTPAPDWTQQMAYLAADRYAEIYQTIKSADPTAKVYCCGQFYTRQSQSNPWFNHFLDRLQQAHPGVGLDGVHIHTYGFTGSAAVSTPVAETCGANQPVGESWWNCLRRALEGYYLTQHDCIGSGCDLTRGKPLLVTEYGYLGVSASVTPPALVDVRDYLMQPLQGWLVNPTQNPGYDGVAWFVTWYNGSKSQTRLYGTNGSQSDQTHLTDLGKQWACP